MNKKTFTYNLNDSEYVPDSFLLSSKNCACNVELKGVIVELSYMPNPADFLPLVYGYFSAGAPDLIDSKNFYGQDMISVGLGFNRYSYEITLSGVKIYIVNQIVVEVVDFGSPDDIPEDLEPQGFELDFHNGMKSIINNVLPINNTDWQPIGG